MSVQVRVDGELHELSDDSVALLFEWLRGMGIFERGEDGEMVAASTAATAALKLQDAVQSQQPIDFSDEELTPVRLIIEQEGNQTRGGFDSLPADLVTLRHAIADRRRRPT